jgi:hypothetical protein
MTTEPPYQQRCGGALLAIARLLPPKVVLALEIG